MQRYAVIMQPTYLPWAGYFDLMDQSGVFVFLDTVQFEKRSWQQRNRIKGTSGEILLTVPVLSKGKQEQKIHEVEIDYNQDFPEKHIKSIRHSYAKTPYGPELANEYEAIVAKKFARLADLNIALITWLQNKLGISRKALKASELGAEGNRTGLLVNICRKLGAKKYLSPLGSRAYIEQENLFEREGIELRYQHYQPAPYRQLYGEFIPYLSVFDLLANEGPESLAVLRSGRNESFTSATLPQPGTGNLS